MMIIDAHSHLWKRQNGLAVADKNGRSIVDGELRQMMPPYMLDGNNTAQMLLANMDYAQVSGAVVTQEYLDGNQDDYLLGCKERYKKRLKICSLYEKDKPLRLDGFDGVKIPAQRLENSNLCVLANVFGEIEKQGKFLSIDLAAGNKQVGYMKELIQQCPELRIAIGHFGMVTREHWEEQIKLARNKNVYIESGGITWLFHHEFYPYPSAVKAIQKASSICGMDKLMWGSDYPRTMVEITYKMSYDFILKSPELTAQSKELFLGKNALRFYSFDGLEEMPVIKNML